MLEFITKRDCDFIAACQKICDGLRQGEQISRRELTYRAIMNGAPSYYVTFDYAHRMLSQLRRNRLPPGYNELKLLMWEEISCKTDHYKKCMGIRTNTQALSIVLARNNASRFFFTVEYGIRLLQQLNHDYHLKNNTTELCVPVFMHNKSSHFRQEPLRYCC